MIITGSGAQTEINWAGGEGTISITPIDSGQNLDANPGSVGDWNSCTVIFEVSYNQGFDWDEMTKDGTTITFEETGITAHNFKSSACKIRANINSGSPSGIGLNLGINSNLG
jgi:hypothetical protein